MQPPMHSRQVKSGLRSRGSGNPVASGAIPQMGTCRRPTGRATRWALTYEELAMPSSVATPWECGPAFSSMSTEIAMCGALSLTKNFVDEVLHVLRFGT